MVLQTADIAAPLNLHLLEKDEAEEIDDELVPVELPDFYKRTFRHPYLQRRGFCFDDYEYFPVGITGRLNPRYADYVVFPVIDDWYGCRLCLPPYLAERGYRRPQPQDQT